MNAVRLALWLSYLLHNIRESWRNYFRTTVDISPSFWCFCVYSIKNFLRSQLFRKFTLSSRLYLVFSLRSTPCISLIDILKDWKILKCVPAAVVVYLTGKPCAYR